MPPRDIDDDALRRKPDTRKKRATFVFSLYAVNYYFIAFRNVVTGLLLSINSSFFLSHVVRSPLEKKVIIEFYAFQFSGAQIPSYLSKQLRGEGVGGGSSNVHGEIMNLLYNKFIGEMFLISQCSWNLQELISYCSTCRRINKLNNIIKHIFINIIICWGTGDLFVLAILRRTKTESFVEEKQDFFSNFML